MDKDWLALCSIQIQPYLKSTKRTSSVAKTILVVLNSENNIHVLLQHLERVLRPDNRIVFLLRYQRDIPTRLLA